MLWRAQIIRLDAQSGVKGIQGDAIFAGDAVRSEFFVFLLDYLEECLAGFSLKKPLAKVSAF